MAKRGRSELGVSTTGVWFRPDIEPVSTAVGRKADLPRTGDPCSSAELSGDEVVGTGRRLFPNRTLMRQEQVLEASFAMAVVAIGQLPIRVPQGA
jgi:hypothetical protein